MKYPLIGSLCLFLVGLTGCQTYPKKPIQVHGGKYEPVNKFVPNELKPYQLPPKVEYIDATKEVPKSIIVVK